MLFLKAADEEAEEWSSLSFAEHLVLTAMARLHRRRVLPKTFVSVLQEVSVFFKLQDRRRRSLSQPVRLHLLYLLNPKHFDANHLVILQTQWPDGWNTASCYLDVFVSTSISMRITYIYLTNIYIYIYLTNICIYIHIYTYIYILNRGVIWALWFLVFRLCVAPS